MAKNPNEQFNINNLSTDQIKDKAEEILNDAPPEVKVAVEKSKTFFEANKPVIVTAIVGVVALKIYRRKIAKTTAKAVIKALNKSGSTEALPNLYDVLEDLRATPGLAYIPHGGGMVHLLKGKDAIVTVFGDFERMDTEELWNKVANVINLNVRQ